MLTIEQVDWLGAYQLAPIATMNFFTTLVAMGKSPFTTKAKTILFDEVKNAASQAKILPRNAEFPVGKKDGVKQQAVTPDIIKDSQVFSAADDIETVPGQVYLQGKPVSNADKKRNDRIQKLKTSIEEKREAVSAEMFFKQTYTSEDGTVLNFTKGATASLTAAKGFDAEARAQETAYQKENKMYPTHRFISFDVYDKLVAIEEAKPNSLSATTLGAEKIGNQEIQYMLRGGKKYYVLPDAVDCKGNPLTSTKQLILFNTNALMPAYAGLANVVNGKPSMEEADVIIRETSANEKTTAAETLGESAYVTLPVIPKAIRFCTFDALAGLK